MTKLQGELEIDHSRGVIYFHCEGGYTVLRICGLKGQIPAPENDQKLYQVDIPVLHSKEIVLSEKAVNQEMEVWGIDTVGRL